MVVVCFTLVKLGLVNMYVSILTFMLQQMNYKPLLWLILIGLKAKLSQQDIAVPF